MNKPASPLDIITSPDPWYGIRRWRPGRRVCRTRNCWLAARYWTVSPAKRKPVSSCAGDFFPICHPPFHAAAEVGQLPEPVPFDAYSQLLSRRFEEAIDLLLARTVGRWPQRRLMQCTGGRLQGPGDPDSGQPGAPQRPLDPRQPVDVSDRTSRRPAPADPPGTPAPICRRQLPDPGGEYACPDGPHAQRLERHLLPGDGLSRGRAGAERVDRPGRPRTRRRPQAAGRGVPAGD